MVFNTDLIIWCHISTFNLPNRCPWIFNQYSSARDWFLFQTLQIRSYVKQTRNNFPKILLHLSKGEKSVQPDQESNLGPFTYRVNDLPAELPGRLHYFWPILWLSLDRDIYTRASWKSVPELQYKTYAVWH